MKKLAMNLLSELGRLYVRFPSRILTVCGVIVAIVVVWLGASYSAFWTALIVTSWLVIQVVLEVYSPKGTQPPEEGGSVTRRHAVIESLKSAFFPICAGVIANFVFRDFGEFNTPQVRKIVLLGEADSPHWVSFERGFSLFLNDEKRGDLSRRNGDDILGKLVVESLANFRFEVHFRPLPESGDPTRDHEEMKALIAELMDEDEVVMIAGFVTSSKADEALHLLEEFQHEEWPTVLLPMATASHLLKEHNPKGKRPLLRLVPPNGEQITPLANKIRELRGTNEAVSVAIFRDRSNYTYSSDLATLLRREVEIKGIAYVVFDGSIGPDGPGSYITDSVVQLRPQCVVFLGMLETGIPLVRQIHAMKGGVQGEEKWNPTILLSDGSVEGGIASFAHGDQIRDIVGFFPHGKPQPIADPHIGSQKFTDPSFEMFGYDTAAFAREICRTAGEGRNKCDRRALRQAVKTFQELWNANKSPIAGKVLVGKYAFDEHGDVKEMPYSEWRFDGKKWALAKDE